MVALPAAAAANAAASSPGEVSRTASPLEPSAAHAHIPAKLNLNTTYSGGAAGKTAAPPAAAASAAAPQHSAAEAVSPPKPSAAQVIAKKY